MYLNCKTYFSFRFGTYGTEELVKEAADKGIASLALTNINNTCDAWDFVDYCNQQGIKPVVGAEIRNNNILQYILLAKNNDGFREINKFLSAHLQEKREFPERFPPYGNVCVIYPFNTELLDENEFEGVQTIEVTKLIGRKDLSRLVLLQPV